MRREALSALSFFILVCVLLVGCSGGGKVPPQSEDATPVGNNTDVIAFTSNHEGNPEVYVMNLDGTGLTRLTHRERRDGYAAWSPDGSKIAFMSGESDHHQLWVMNVDGSEKTRLTNNAFDDWRPIWSPDGTRIAFNSFREDMVGVFLMNADGSGERHLTPFTDHAMQVAWHPNPSR